MISYPQEPQGLDIWSVYSHGEGGESEYDYDEYDFRPSISPYLLFPVESTTSPLLPPLFENGPRQLPPSPEYDDDGIEWCGEDSLLLSPGYSPIYSYNSDFTLLDHSSPPSTSTTGLSVIGYSKVFTSGLVSKSRKITRQLDWFRRKLQDVLRMLKPTT